MSITLNKDGGTELPAAIAALEIELTFEQESTGGLLSRMRNRLDPADPDLYGLALVGTRPVDYVNPKAKTSTLGGALAHMGDARGAGGEVIRVDLARITREDSDIDGIAFAAVIDREDGFSRIPGAAARVYDVSGDDRRHIGNVRPDITGRFTCISVGVFARRGSMWVWFPGAARGYARDWREACGVVGRDIRSALYG